MEYVLLIAQSIIAFVFGVITWKVRNHLEKNAKETAKKEEDMRLALEQERKYMDEMRQAIMRGTQSLLRDRLLQGFHFFKKRGMVTYGEASSYQNMYEAYHSLGKNGVMDEIYHEFQQIPIRPDSEVYPDE